MGKKEDGKKRREIRGELIHKIYYSFTFFLPIKNAFEKICVRLIHQNKKY